MKKILLFTCSLIWAAITSAQIIHVPGDYPTIQQAIDSAATGDTVLVAPGTYTSNLYISDKDITVASWFLTTLDPAYIEQTILDGNQSGSVVTFNSMVNPDALLCGFTIMNGVGSWEYGGGIAIWYANPTLDHLIIKNNSVFGGWGWGGYGGGISCYESSPVIRHVHITNNSASYGGGIYCYNSNLFLTSVTICNNSVSVYGGGVYFEYSSSAVFDPYNRCSIYLNSAETGNDLYNAAPVAVHVILDTFSVLNPTPYFAYPPERFTFDILHGKIEQVEADLFVSPTGDDNNSGLTSAWPLKTIRMATIKMLADSLHPHTIHLLAGTYSTSATGEVFPIKLPAYFSLSGVAESDVILHAEGRTALRLSYRGNEVTDLTITGGYGWVGGGIYCENSDPLIKNVTLTGNAATEAGGAIYCSGSNATLENVKVINNSASYGGGMYLQNNQLTLRNVQFSNNHADYGGGLYIGAYSQLFLSHTSIFNNSATEQGGGVFFPSLSNCTFDPNDRCNIYLNSAGEGNDLLHYGPQVVNVIVDTFSVLYPTQYFAYPLSWFSFDILHGKIEQVEADLYVSPAGDDNNSGLTPEYPLKKIKTAMTKMVADSLHPHTIHLQEGVYGPSGNGEVFPVFLYDYVTLSGASQSGTILDCEGVSQAVRITNAKGTSLKNLTITGGIGSNYSHRTGGIYCTQSETLIQDVTLTGNSGSYGGAMYLESSKAEMERITMNNNISTGDGGGGYFGGLCDLTFHDVTVNGNSAYNGGGLYFTYMSGAEMQNVRIAGNTATSRGGGIYLNQSSPFMRGVTVAYNTAGQGGGMYLRMAGPVFDTLSRCNIYLNDANQGDDLYTWGDAEIVLDTFTVLRPRRYQAYPLENFSFDIQHGLLPQLNVEVYVSPNGDDANSGLTAEEPVKHISHALAMQYADSLNYYTVHLLNGTYSPSASGETFPLTLQDGTTLQGESVSGVILDGEGLSGILISEGHENSIASMTIKGGHSGIGGGIQCRGNTIIREVTVTGCQAGEGGGIFATGKSLIQQVTLSGNQADRGAGLYVSGEKRLQVSQVFIEGNNASAGAGGGIYIEGNPALSDVHVTGNHADTGGGIGCQWGSQPEFSNITIDNNSARLGGGIYFVQNSNALFDSVNRCNIYLNQAAFGNDLYANQAMINIVVDTFTFLYPNAYLAFPQSNFSFDILHGKLQLISADLYVAPGGSNTNSGLTPADPLKSIRIASTLMATGPNNSHTIHLADGTYSPSITGEPFPVLLSDYCHLSGNSSNSVILDGEGSTVIALMANNHSVISGLTIKGGSKETQLTGFRGGIWCDTSNSVLQDLIITNNLGEGIFMQRSSPLIANTLISHNAGSGIYCKKSHPSLMNLVISNNTASEGTGGGLLLKDSNPRLMNLLISDNTAAKGGGIYCNNSSPLLIHTTFSGNTANFGGGIFAGNGSHPDILNSVFWDNPPKEIMLQGVYAPNSIEVAYSDIKGGVGGIMVSGVATVQWLDGNMDANPLFSASGENPFSLSAESPCIDAAMPDTTGLFLPPTDLAGNPRIWNNRSDMGAYEWNNVGIERPATAVESLEVFPNPFADVAIIEVSISRATQATVRVLNAMAQQAAVFVADWKAAGTYRLQWDAGQLPPGVYMIQFAAGDHVIARKAIRQ